MPDATACKLIVTIGDKIASSISVAESFSRQLRSAGQIFHELEGKQIIISRFFLIEVPYKKMLVFIFMKIEREKTMKHSIFTCIFLLLIYTSSNAGTLTDGTWLPSSACGEEPVVPSIDPSSVDGFNRSLEAIRIWQGHANEYIACMIDEANTDNALIAETANEKQEKFQAEVDRINQDAIKIKADLDGN